MIASDLVSTVDAWLAAEPDDDIRDELAALRRRRPLTSSRSGSPDA